MPVKISNKPLVRINDATQAITRERLQNDERVKLSSGRQPYEYYIVVANALDQHQWWVCQMKQHSSYFELHKIVRISMGLRASTSLRLMHEDADDILPCHRTGRCMGRLNRKTLLSVWTGFYMLSDHEQPDLLTWLRSP